MTILILGVILWAAVFLAGPKLPGGKGAKHGLAALAVVLMVIGYRQAEGSFYWGRSPMLTGINNLLVLIAVYLGAAHGMKTAAARALPHPLLASVLLWAVAHLLVNGDTPSFVLFGGLGLWALVQMAVSPRAPVAAAKPAKFEAFALIGAVLVFGLIAIIHKALGYPVFG